MPTEGPGVQRTAKPPVAGVVEKEGAWDASAWYVRRAPLTPWIGTRAFALVLVATSSLAGCSFVVETSDAQCTQDSDCAPFNDAFCDVPNGVCIPRGSTGTAACVGPDGCFACDPVEPVEILNACTDANCVPYDNAQIADLLEEDGSVPPVP
jgi:hypothetical protein